MSTTPTAATHVDHAAPMRVIHGFLRREFRLAADLVRRVPDGDITRASVVDDHLDFIDRALHHHHTLEDDLLWPPLRARVPADLVPVVELMEDQHRRLGAILAVIDERRPEWRDTASATAGGDLAGRYDELYTHLAEHLDAEEDRLLPIAERALTGAEWDALGQAGRERTDRRDLTLAFGMFQYEGDPATIATMLADAPAPVRWIVPRLARRAFRRHAIAVHGTATP